MDPLPRVGRSVVLRRLRLGDLSALQAYRNNESVGLYQGWSAQTAAQALAFIEEMSSAPISPNGKWVQLAVAEPGTNALIGDIGVCVAVGGASAELGITVAPHFQRRHLGTEALREAIGLVFDCSPAVRVMCVTDARNTPSIRLVERAGMRRTSVARAVFRGDPCVEYTYSAFRHDGA